MRPFPISVANQLLSAREPIVRLARELRHGTVGRGAVQQTEGALVHLSRSAAVHVLAGRRGAGPTAA